jgi:hypothetical protein
MFFAWTTKSTFMIVIVKKIENLHVLQEGYMITQKKNTYVHVRRHVKRYKSWKSSRFAGRVPDYVEKKNGGGTHMCGCPPISEGIFSVHEQ